MKVRFLLGILFLILIQYYPQAQLTTPIKAKEGQDKAIQYVSGTDFPSPVFVAAGAMNGQPDESPIGLTFDVATGTANAWAYLFISATDPDTMTAVAVTKIIGLGLQAIPIPTNVITTYLDFAPDSSLEDREWMNSDTMSILLRSNSEYLDYISAHPFAEVLLVSVSVNNLNPHLEENTTYWSAVIGESTGEQIECFINALSGEVNCLATSVDDNIPGETWLQAYPNPASDKISFRIPANMQSIGSKMAIVDVLGSPVKELIAPSAGEAELVSIPLDGIADGMYFIRYTNAAGNYTIPFIVNR